MKLTISMLMLIGFLVVITTSAQKGEFVCFVQNCYIDWVNFNKFFKKFCILEYFNWLYVSGEEINSEGSENQMKINIPICSKVENWNDGPCTDEKCTQACMRLIGKRALLGKCLSPKLCKCNYVCDAKHS